MSFRYEIGRTSNVLHLEPASEIPSTSGTCVKNCSSHDEQDAGCFPELPTVLVAGYSPKHNSGPYAIVQSFWGIWTLLCAPPLASPGFDPSSPKELGEKVPGGGLLGADTSGIHLYYGPWWFMVLQTRSGV